MPSEQSREEIPELIHGRTWEEMPVGFAFRTGGRTISEADLIAFISLTGMIEPLFYDEQVSKDLGYTGRLVPGMQTFCYAEGLVIQTGSIHGTGLAHMRCGIDIKAPVYVGDTIHVVVEVIEQRAASKGNRGVITTRNTVFKQDGSA